MHISSVAFENLIVANDLDINLIDLDLLHLFSPAFLPEYILLINISSYGYFLL